MAHFEPILFLQTCALSIVNALFHNIESEASRTVMCVWHSGMIAPRDASIVCKSSVISNGVWLYGDILSLDSCES